MREGGTGNQNFQDHFKSFGGSGSETNLLVSNSTGSINEKRMRYRSDLVEVFQRAGHDNGKPQAICSGEEFRLTLLGIEAHREDFEALVVIALVQAVQVRQLRTAGPSPACPKVEDHHPALELG